MWTSPLLRDGSAEKSTDIEGDGVGGCALGTIDSVDVLSDPHDFSKGTEREPAGVGLSPEDSLRFSARDAGSSFGRRSFLDVGPEGQVLTWVHRGRHTPQLGNFSEAILPS